MKALYKGAYIAPPYNTSRPIVLSSVTPTTSHMLFKRTPIAGSYNTMTALVFHECDNDRKLSYNRARNVSIGFNLERSFVLSHQPQERVDACELLEWIDCQIHKKIYG